MSDGKKWEYWADIGFIETGMIDASDAKIHKLSADDCHHFVWTMFSDHSTGDDYEYWRERLGVWFWVNGENERLGSLMADWSS